MKYEQIATVVIDAYLLIAGILTGMVVIILHYEQGIDARSIAILCIVLIMMFLLIRLCQEDLELGKLKFW